MCCSPAVSLYERPPPSYHLPFPFLHASPVMSCIPAAVAPRHPFPPHFPPQSPPFLSSTTSLPCCGCTPGHSTGTRYCLLAQGLPTCPAPDLLSLFVAGKEHIHHGPAFVSYYRWCLVSYGHRWRIAGVSLVYRWQIGSLVCRWSVVSLVCRVTGVSCRCCSWCCWCCWCNLCN